MFPLIAWQLLLKFLSCRWFICAFLFGFQDMLTVSKISSIYEKGPWTLHSYWVLDFTFLNHRGKECGETKFACKLQPNCTKLIALCGTPVKEILIGIGGDWKTKQPSLKFTWTLSKKHICKNMTKNILSELFVYIDQLLKIHFTPLYCDCRKYRL